jgi:RNA polymerase sigma factor (sigma-70 family)
VGTASVDDSRLDDASLVARSLAGNRDAFGRIVSRYQSLVCSVAYSATGSLTHSEDLAQETFLAAWKELSTLREPDKLRPWLCGIARNVVHSTQRREKLEPTAGGEPIESAEDTPAVQPLASEQAISKEEEAILWRSIEGIPESYREPMVLFYREHQSVEKVATALGLSEDVIRQRLSRGRKLLHAQVLAFVEGVLERSSPGESFTLGVVAALPAYSASAVATVVAATAAKGSVLAKAASVVAAFTAFLALSTSVLSGYATIRANLNVMRTKRERAVLFRQLKVMVAGGLILVAAMIALIRPRALWLTNSGWMLGFAALTAVGYSVWLPVMLLRYTKETRQVRAEEERLYPELFHTSYGASAGRLLEYRSSATMLGLPLLHVRYAGTAVGWIAIGDRAVGVLFAMGAVAVGGVSVGSASAGIIAVGGVSVGVISLGSVAYGIFALGTLAAGVVALGALAVGWTGASGAIAVAHDYALGGVAIAEHPNDAVASAFAGQHHLAFVFYFSLALIFILAVGPTSLMAWWTRRLRSSSSMGP